MGLPITTVRRFVTILILAAGLIATGCAGSDSGDAVAQASPYREQADRMERLKLGPGKALGQLLVGRFNGTTPSREMLNRIRSGRLGGVIFFADNVAEGGKSIRRATRMMQRAAIAGGNPPLIFAIDQEGGIVKRLPGPPHTAPPDIRSDKQALRQGRLTGRYLHGFGINVNFAPVADVPVGNTFIRERTFGDSPATVARRSCAFARGLIVEGVAATLKHFPGLGRAELNTDNEPEKVTAEPRQIRSGYAPYRACGKSFMTLTMMSSAAYPNLIGGEPAVIAPATYRRELTRAGARGVTVSDDLETPSFDGVRAPATRAIRAGLNLALYAGTEQGSATAYRVLGERMRSDALPGRLIVRRSQPVLRLKALIEPGPTARFLADREP